VCQLHLDWHLAAGAVTGETHPDERSIAVDLQLERVDPQIGGLLRVSPRGGAGSLR
jgi:hypothetical protein